MHGSAVSPWSLLQNLNVPSTVTVMYFSSGPLPTREKYANECPVLLKPFSTSLSYFVLRAIRKLVCSVKTHRNKCIHDKEKNNDFKSLGIRSEIGCNLRCSSVPLSPRLGRIPEQGPYSAQRIFSLPDTGSSPFLEKRNERRLHSQARVEPGQEH